MSTEDRFASAHPLVLEAADPDGRPIEDLVAELPLLMREAGLSVRDSQIKMASMIAQGCERESWTAVHAPCGTGKSLAYLLAGMLHRERVMALYEEKDNPDPKDRPGPVVVSTSNISLQSQLLTKDVPLASKLLGVRFHAVVLKGRSNYLCPRNVEQERVSLIGPRVGHLADVGRLITWLDRGGSGDKEDVTFSYDGRAWADLSRDGNSCIGKACDYRDTCPSERAKIRTLTADIVITNHSYLAVGNLPDNVPLLVVDEAHALEGALLRARTSQLSVARAQRTANRIAKILHMTDSQLHKQLVAPVEAMIQRAEKGLPENEWGDLPLPAGWCGALPEDPNAWYGARIRRTIESEWVDMDPGPEKEEVRVVLGDLDRLRGVVLFVREGTRVKDLDPEHTLAHTPAVVWAHKEPNRDTVLRVGLPDVTPKVRALRIEYPCVVLCSATLASAGDLKAFTMTLGMESGSDLPPPEIQGVLPSPFDIPRQALSVIPHGPSPKTGEAWRTWRNEIAVEAVRASQGGALILSSSWRGAREIAEALRRAQIDTPSGRLSPYRVQLQGEQSRRIQLERFAEDRDGVLVGTRSLFEGVDIPGDACRLVIVDRIPFGSPSDPLEQGVIALAEERYKGSGFMLRTLPAALMALEQAAGRLVRSSTDRGVFVLLDSRAHDPGMIGPKVMRALAPMTMSTRLTDITRWMEKA